MVAKKIHDAVQKIIWQPNSVPQRSLLECPVFEVFFGGARGGGKTDGMLGEWANHSSQYGKLASGLMIRREKEQLKDTIKRSRQIFGPIGGRFDKQSKTWTMPGGATLVMAYLASDSDAEKYQGWNLCVGVGTGIRMADGSHRAIEEIRRGDWVQTLEGARRVLGHTAPYHAPCVDVEVLASSGEVLGEQRHPIWHPVLSSEGLISRRNSQIRRSVGQLLRGIVFGGTRDQEPRICENQDILGWYAYSRDGRNGYTGSRESLSEIQPLVGCSVPVVLHAPDRRSSGLHGHVAREAPIECHSHGRSGPRSLLKPAIQERLSLGLLRLRARLGWWLARADLYPANAPSYAQHVTSAVAGSQVGYPSDPHSSDERIPSGARSGQGILRRLGGVAAKFLALLSDGLDTIQTRSHSDPLRMVHPYTGEERNLSEPVAIGEMRLSGVSWGFVADICVEGANHYISECGLINKNTRLYVEEIGNFPDPAPILKLFATLRVKGAHLGFRATGNPGGPGHQWVKQRYIDPAPLGNVIIGTMYGDVVKERIYIPSRVTDNKNLDQKEYIASLKMQSSGELVRAWLDGDWNAVLGAYFTEQLDVVEPCPIPESWPRFRAMDWGSAAPFAVQWFAIVEDSAELPVGWKTGDLVMYREWYGASAPNKGLKLTTEQVADGIKGREDGEKISYGVCDPSMGKQDGGPSIKERMFERGVSWHSGDNSRIAGHQMVRRYLKERRLHVFSTCLDLIRTLPALQHDKRRPEDLDTEGEDHAYDALRYAVMSRPRAPEREAPPPPVGWKMKAETGMSIDEIIRRSDEQGKNKGRWTPRV